MTNARSHFQARVVLAALPISTAVLASSCSLSLHNQGQAPEFTQSSRVQPAPHLAQMGFGRQTEFGLCVPAACPAVTPKTLARSVSPAPPIAAAPLQGRPPTIASTLDAGEEIIAPSPPATKDTASPPRLETESAVRTVTVYFPFDDVTLSDAAKAALDAAVAEMPDVRHIEASGRTDSIGADPTNSAIAAARAGAVHDYLVARYPHLTPVLKIDSKGSCCYVAPNETQQGRSLNRRVDVRLSRDDEARP